MSIVPEIFKLGSKKLYEIDKGIDFNFDQFSEQACQNSLDQIAKALLKLDDLLAVKLKETGYFIIVKKHLKQFTQRTVPLLLKDDIITTS